MKRLPAPFPNAAVGPQSAHREKPHRKLFLNSLFRYGDVGSVDIFARGRLLQRLAPYVKRKETDLRSSSKNYFSLPFTFRKIDAKGATIRKLTTTEIYVISGFGITQFRIIAAKGGSYASLGLGIWVVVWRNDHDGYFWGSGSGRNRGLDKMVVQPIARRKELTVSFGNSKKAIC